MMKYNCTLTRKFKIEPEEVILEFEIPDHLDDEGRLIFASQELLKLHAKKLYVHIDPIQEEG